MAKSSRVIPQGDFIKKLRAEKGFTTQEKFAAAIQVDVRLVRFAERGSPSTPKTIHAIADGLGVPYEYLIRKSFPTGFHKDVDISDVTVDSDAPSLKDRKLKYFVIGLRVDDDIANASVEKHAHPVIQDLKAHRDVEYIGFMGFEKISSFLVRLELSADAIINVVIPAFADRDLDQFEITAIYLPFEFQQYVVPPFKYLHPAQAIPIMFEMWLKRRDLQTVGASFLNDGTVILSWRLPVEAEVLV